MVQRTIEIKAMMLQLNPMIPIVRDSDGMKGYAMLVIDYSQEHDLLFTCAMDNGEIWTLGNKDIRMNVNVTLNRIYEKGKQRG